MKYLFSLVLLCFLSFSTNAQTSAKEMVDQIFMPTIDGVFRGFDFSTLEVALNEEEEKRSKITLSYEDIDENLYYLAGYDIKFDEYNYAYIDYTVDFIGITQILGEIYAETDSKALEIFNELNKHYTNKLGLGALQSDGWTKFSGLYKAADPYDVWIFLDEDEYGKFNRFVINYMGEE